MIKQNKFFIDTIDRVRVTQDEFKTALRLNGVLITKPIEEVIKELDAKGGNKLLTPTNTVDKVIAKINKDKGMTIGDDIIKVDETELCCVIELEKKIKARCVLGVEVVGYVDIEGVDTIQPFCYITDGKIVLIQDVEDLIDKDINVYVV